MNKHVFDDKWKRLQGQAKQWWGKLTHDDRKRIGGQLNQFVGVLQVECSYTGEHAEEGIDRRMAEHEAHTQEVATPAEKNDSIELSLQVYIASGDRASRIVWNMDNS